MEVKNFGRVGSIAPIDMAISKGEIVGLAGLLGSGRTETARLLFGVDKPQTGEMLIEGRKVAFHTPRQAIREGFAFTPEDRKVEGVAPHLSVREISSLHCRRARARPIRCHVLGRKRSPTSLSRRSASAHRDQSKRS
jgi:galactofuranose transport system ATP-binding protein